MTTICIKMKTGEDIITRISTSILTGGGSLEDTPPTMPSGEITIEDPRVISLQEVPGGRMALALLPYLMGDHEASMVINLKDCAVGVYRARKEIEDSYLQQTTQLALPKTSGIALS